MACQAFLTDSEIFCKNKIKISKNVLTKEKSCVIILGQ